MRGGLNHTPGPYGTRKSPVLRGLTFPNCAPIIHGTINTLHSPYCNKYIYDKEYLHFFAGKISHMHSHSQYVFF